MIASRYFFRFVSYTFFLWTFPLPKIFYRDPICWLRRSMNRAVMMKPSTETSWFMTWWIIMLEIAIGRWVNCGHKLDAHGQQQYLEKLRLSDCYWLALWPLRHWWQPRLLTQGRFACRWWQNLTVSLMQLCRNGDSSEQNSFFFFPPFFSCQVWVLVCARCTNRFLFLDWGQPDVVVCCFSWCVLCILSQDVFFFRSIQ